MTKITEMKINEIVEMAKENKDLFVSTKIVPNRGSVPTIGLVSKDGRPAPTYSLDKLDNVIETKTARECLDLIIGVLKGTNLVERIDLGKITDFESVKEKIFFKLLSANKNQAYEVKKEFLDLIKVYYVKVDLPDLPDDENASITVNQALFEKWNVDIDTLDAIASENVEKELLVMNLADALRGMGVPLSPEDDTPMFVVTNKDKINGASEMISKSVLEKFREKWGTFYILPSSIHEVLFVKPQETEREEREAEIEALRDVVYDVNTTQVAPDEILSFSVYKCEDGVVSVA